MAKKEYDLRELAGKLKFNSESVEYGLKEKPKETEKQIIDAAKFMGLI